MLYIVTEDSNSARDFWQCTADTFRGKGNYTMAALSGGSDRGMAAGNTTLEKQVFSLLPQMHSGDELFVVFDNIANTKGFNAADFIRKTAEFCIAKEVAFRFTNYYCFEELYLSYNELIRLYEKIESPNPVVLNALKYVYKHLQEGTDYFFKSNPNVADFIKQRSRDTGKNREHFANQLLVEATSLLKGHFKLIKSGHAFFRSGECWIKDCGSIQHDMHKKQVENVCHKQCDFCCKYCGTKDKLLDLDKKSICQKGDFSLCHI